MGNKSSKLDKEQVKELKSSTSFDDKQIQQWYRGFQKDYPQKISKQDFQALYKNYFPFGDATKYSTYIFNHIDLNGDGFIDFFEFMKALEISAKGTAEARLSCICI